MMQTNDMTYDEKVDLNTIQPGDVAVLRCGGGECEITKRGIYSAGVFLDGVALSYYENGNKKDGSSDPHPFDIIAIKRKPFDWSQAKPGMAFRQPWGGEVIWFMGKNPLYPKSYHFVSSEITVISERYLPGDVALLTRAPEFDVEV